MKDDIILFFFWDDIIIFKVCYHWLRWYDKAELSWYEILQKVSSQSDRKYQKFLNPQTKKKWKATLWLIREVRSKKNKQKGQQRPKKGHLDE